MRRCRATLAQGKGPSGKAPCRTGFIRADLFQFSSVSAEIAEYELVSQTHALKLAAVTTVSLFSKHVTVNKLKSNSSQGPRPSPPFMCEIPAGPQETGFGS